MSTGGGKLARQPLNLVPEQGQGSVIAVGWIELPLHRATVKTFRCLSSAHQARGRSLDVDEASYATFTDWVGRHLGQFGITLTLDDEITPSMRPPAGQPERTRERQTDILPYAAVALLAFLFGASVGGVVVYAKFVGF